MTQWGGRIVFQGTDHPWRPNLWNCRLNLPMPECPRACVQMTTYLLAVFSCPLPAQIAQKHYNEITLHPEDFRELLLDKVRFQVTSRLCCTHSIWLCMGLTGQGWELCWLEKL